MQAQLTESLVTSLAILLPAFLILYALGSLLKFISIRTPALVFFPVLLGILGVAYWIFSVSTDQVYVRLTGQLVEVPLAEMPRVEDSVHGDAMYKATDAVIVDRAHLRRCLAKAEADEAANLNSATKKHFNSDWRDTTYAQKLTIFGSASSTDHTRLIHPNYYVLAEGNYIPHRAVTEAVANSIRLATLGFISPTADESPTYCPALDIFDPENFVALNPQHPALGNDARFLGPIYLIFVTMLYGGVTLIIDRLRYRRSQD